MNKLLIAIAALSVPFYGSAAPIGLDQRDAVCEYGGNYTCLTFCEFAGYSGGHCEKDGSMDKCVCTNSTNTNLKDTTCQNGGNAACWAYCKVEGHSSGHCVGTEPNENCVCTSSKLEEQPRPPINPYYCNPLECEESCFKARAGNGICDPMKGCQCTGIETKEKSPDTCDELSCSMGCQTPDPTKSCFGHCINGYCDCTCQVSESMVTDTQVISPDYCDYGQCIFGCLNQGCAVAECQPNGQCECYACHHSVIKTQDTSVLSSCDTISCGNQCRASHPGKECAGYCEGFEPSKYCYCSCADIDEVTELSDMPGQNVCDDSGCDFQCRFNNPACTGQCVGAFPNQVCHCTCSIEYDEPSVTETKSVTGLSYCYEMQCTDQCKENNPGKGCLGWCPSGIEGNCECVCNSNVEATGTITETKSVTSTSSCDTISCSNKCRASHPGTNCAGFCEGFEPNKYCYCNCDGIISTGEITETEYVTQNICTEFGCNMRCSSSEPSGNCVGQCMGVFPNQYCHCTCSINGENTIIKSKSLTPISSYDVIGCNLQCNTSYPGKNCLGYYIDVGKDTRCTCSCFNTVETISECYQAACNAQCQKMGYKQGMCGPTGDCQCAFSHSHAVTVSSAHQSSCTQSENKSCSTMCGMMGCKVTNCTVIGKFSSCVCGNCSFGYNITMPSLNITSLATITKPQMSCQVGGRAGCIASCKVQGCETGYCEGTAPNEVCVCSRCSHNE